MCVDIKHYLSTFYKKPGALRNSQALKAEPELKDIFDIYYKDNPKLFIDTLKNNIDLPIEELIDVLKPHISLKNKVNNLVENETMKQLKDITNLFIGGTVNDNIIH